MNDYEFSKELIDCGNYITVIFKGKENKQNIDHKVLEKICNNYFTKDIKNLDVYMVVSHIRTIFKDFDESELSICIRDGDKKIYNINYKNKKLVKFYIKEKDQSNNFICLNYSNAGIKFDIEKGDLFNNFVDKTNFEKTFSKYLNNLYSLLFVNEIKIDGEVKILCEIYKLFYNDYPDFNSKNIFIRMQTMIYILKEFGVVISNEYIFNNLNDMKMPYSEKINKIIEKMKAYDKMDKCFDVNLNNKMKEKILVISNIIKKSKNKEVPIEKIMLEFSCALYTIRYCLSLGSNEDDICNYLNYTRKSVDNFVKINKLINKRLYEKN